MSTQNNLGDSMTILFTEKEINNLWYSVNLNVQIL